MSISMVSADQPTRKVIDWTLKELTIKQVMEVIVPYTNIHPIYNRHHFSYLFGGLTPSKLQSIIESIMMGKDVGEITLAEPGEKSDHEVLDGSNRMRAIIDFYRNKFPIHESCAHSELAGKKFNDLSLKDREFFLSYRLRILNYKGMTNQEKGEHFQLRNSGTPVNKMEMLNAFGRIPVADFVRATARIIPDEPTKPHELFKSVVHNKDQPDEKIVWTYLNFQNVGLKHDEMVARITYMMYRGVGLVPCDHKKDQLLGMYTDADLKGARLASIARKTIECLDFLLDVAKAKIDQKKPGLETHEFTLLYRWYIRFTTTNGPFKLTDPGLFFRALEQSLIRFTSKDSNVWLQEKGDDGIYRVMTYGSNKSARSVSGPKGAFMASLGQHGSLPRMSKCYEWFTKDAGFDPERDGSIKLLDSRRNFSRRDVEVRLIEQGGLCYVTGEPLAVVDAEGAHVVAHSHGGLTEVGNLVVVHRNHNRKMGTTDAREYRERYLAEKTVA